MVWLITDDQGIIVAMAQAFESGLIARRLAWSASEDQSMSSIELREQVIGYIDAIRATAAVFAADNPRFDRERFLNACGVQS